MKTTKFLTLMTVVVMVFGLVSVSYAGTGRFSGLTVMYTVTNQAEADALPDVIDATGYQVAVLVDGNDIILSGLTISGVSGESTANVNIAVDGSTNVEVKDCVLTGAYSSIYFYASTGRVVNCEVSGYVKNGITANMPSSDDGAVQIMGNTVTGSGPVGPGSWAQNGIQIGYGARGTVLDNTVNGNWYTGDDWGASGILIFESSDCLVQGNTVNNNEMGIVVETWSWIVADASNNKIVRNTVQNGDYGITISAYDIWGYASDDSTANNNKVTKNMLDTLSVGVALTSYDDDLTNEFNPSVDNCKVVANNFNAVTTNIEQYGDTTTKIQANTP